MKYLLVSFYTGITTFLYFIYVYREDASMLQLFIATVIIHLPIIFSNSSYRLNLTYLHFLTIFSFCVGFIAAAIITNNNIWPIALVFWLVLTIPGILVLNFICYLDKKNRGLEDKTEPYLQADIFEACKKLNTAGQTDGNKNV
ncbi:MAG: hypothetical protein GY928_29070 [Colwellia sp.]|nr:hypothetical protein [Colwellia sp.]